MDSFSQKVVQLIKSEGLSLPSSAVEVTMGALNPGFYKKSCGCPLWEGGWNGACGLEHQEVEINSKEIAYEEVQIYDIG